MPICKTCKRWKQPEEFWRTTRKYKRLDGTIKIYEYLVKNCKKCLYKKYHKGYKKREKMDSSFFEKSPFKKLSDQRRPDNFTSNGLRLY